jgi:alpha-tubulin suppressor-like RCC1 family protein
VLPLPLHLTTMHRRIAFRLLVASAVLTTASCKEPTAPVDTFRPLPAAVIGGRVFEDITGGDFHACGLTPDKKAYCWGVNTQGQSGNGLSSDEGIGTPLEVVGGYLFTQLSAGGSHTCGIRDDGETLCWGNNAVGQLGTGTAPNRFEPTVVVGGHLFTRVSASTFATTCALTAAGEAWCWGDNTAGAVGDGTTASRTIPTEVSGRLQFASISTGGQHTCALTIDGTAYCWGLNSRGQIGDGTISNRLVPTPVATAQKFAMIASGLTHTCALNTMNKAYCWGDNVGGALGDGTVESKSTPVAVDGDNDFSTLTVGERHACGITVEGITLCWGFNNFGALGDGTTVTRLEPVPVTGSLIFKKIAAGAYFTCGISASNTTYCWGNNEGHQLGSASDTP